MKGINDVNEYSGSPKWTRVEWFSLFCFEGLCGVLLRDAINEVRVRGGLSLSSSNLEMKILST